MQVYYIIPLNCWLTGHPYNSTELLVDWTSKEFQNQTLLFSEKIKSTM